MNSVYHNKLCNYSTPAQKAPSWTNGKPFTSKGCITWARWSRNNSHPAITRYSRSDLSTDNIQTVSTLCFHLFRWVFLVFIQIPTYYAVFWRFILLPHALFYCSYFYYSFYHFFYQYFNYRYTHFYIFLRCVFYSNFSIHDVAYVQFYQDYTGLPEDGAPDAPKHVGARWYSKYMIIFKNAFRWSFFHHNLKNSWSKPQKCILTVMFMYSYCYVCPVLGILFHCVVLCTVCV
jgi:hypothetical protein